MSVLDVHTAAGARLVRQAPAANGGDPASGLIVALLGVLFLYNGLFSFLTPGLNQIFVYTYPLMTLICIAAVVRTGSGGRFNMSGLLFLGAILFVAVLPSVLHGQGSYVLALRSWIGIAFLAAIICAANPPRPRARRVIMVMALGAAALFTFVALAYPPVFLRTERLASITGGAGLVHPSAYLVLGLACILAMALDVGGRLRILGLAALAVMLGLVYQYQVRTVWLMVVVMAAAWLHFAVLIRVRPMVLTALLYAVLFVVVALVAYDFVQTEQQIEELGSGRIGTYLHRLEILAARDTVERLFGTGAGTDLFRGTLTWLHAEKDSHNDILSVLIEHGALGLGVLVLLFLKGWRCGGVATRILLLGAISASFVSNGALFRPSVSIFYGIAIWMSLPSRAVARPDPG